VAGGKGKGSIQVYESDTCRLGWEGEGTAFDMTRLAYSPDGRSIVTADDGGYATLWHERSGQVLGSVQVASAEIGSIQQVAFGPNGSELVVLDSRGRISKWDLPAKRLKWEDRPPDGPYTGFAFSPDKKVFARMWRRREDHYGELQLLAGVDGDVLAAVRCRHSYLACICFSPDGKYIATGGHWGTYVVRIWDVGRLTRQTLR
jgi:WD40 repeat protein